MSTPGQPDRPADIDAYISAFAPDVQALLQQVRLTIRAAAPEARECISYRMPAFRQGRGQGQVLVYFAAFKHHIGLYPPARGDARLEQALAPYAGDKGNLRFPFGQALPLDLIERVTRWRLQQVLGATAARPVAKP